MKIKFKDFEERENKKAAVDFDKKFGTTLSQHYKYPNNMSENDVWYNIKKYSANKKYGLESFDRLMDILNQLDDYFPYIDLSNLSNKEKFDILYGMVSGYNSDDIIWYSVDHMIGTKNIEVNNEIEKLPYHIKINIGWVLSPKTLKKLKKQLHLSQFKDDKDFEWWD